MRVVASHEVRINKTYINTSFRVSIIAHNMYFHSDNNPINKFKAGFLRWFWNRRFLNKVINHIDDIGLNYYFHRRFGNKNID